MHPLLVPFAFLAFVSLGLPDGVLGPSWPAIREAFGVPLDALGIVVTAYTAGYLVSSFMGGALMRRVAVGTLLALATGLASAGLLGFAMAPSFIALVVAALMAGLAGGAIDAALNAFGARHFSARILNWLHGFYGVGTTLGPLIVTLVLSVDAGWRMSFLVVGCAQAGLAVAFALTRSAWDTVRDHADQAAVVPPAATGETLRRPSVWLGMALFALYAGVEIGTAHWSYSVLTLGRDVPEVTAGLYVTAYWASLTAGRLGFGVLAGRVNLKRALAVAMVSAAAGALLFWLSPHPAVAPVALCIMGLSLAPIFASLISLTPERVGLAHADTTIGVQVAAASLGGAAFTAGIGVIAQLAGLNAVGGMLFVLTLSMLALYAGFLRPVGKSLSAASP